VHDTATDAKRNTLSRRESRLVEDALKELSKHPGFRSMSRQAILAAVAAAVAADVPRVTKPNLLSAAEALDITLPGGRDDLPDAFTPEDREMIVEMGLAIDELVMQAFDPLDTRRVRWAQFRAKQRAARTLF